MDGTFSKTQIDKLGERLRAGAPTEEDLLLPDSYRRTFNAPYETTVNIIRTQLNYQPTGRPSKSTSSIREKLLRESIRLSQMQDIAGCRIITLNTSTQNEAVERITRTFANATKTDRRTNPSHGYRAVHVIVDYADKSIEIRCRTELQHLWSQLSERLADTFDPMLKYGAGHGRWQSLLHNASQLVGQIESDESAIVGQSLAAEQREKLKTIFRETIHWVSNLRDE
jgi:putative GTP pyrophosphokinase